VFLGKLIEFECQRADAQRASLTRRMRPTDQRAGDTVLGRVASAALFFTSGFVFIARLG